MSAKAQREKETREFIRAVELILSEKGQDLYHYFGPQSLTPDERARLREFSTRVNQPLGPPSAAKTRGASTIYSPSQESTAQREASVGVTPNVNNFGPDIVMDDLPFAPPIELSSSDAARYWNTSEDWISPLIRLDNDNVDDLPDSPNDERDPDLRAPSEADDDGLHIPTRSRSNDDKRRVSSVSNPSEEPGERDPNDNSTQTIPEKRKPGRPLKYHQSTRGSVYHNNNWRPMIETAESKLHPKFERLLHHMADRPTADLAAHIFARSKTPCMPLIQYEKPDEEILAKLCLKLIEISPKKQNKGKKESVVLFEHLVWCFHALAIGDVVVNIFGGKVALRSQSSRKMQLLMTLAREDRAKAANGLLVARNIFFVCQEFGIGTLFFFTTDLTEHFLKDLVTKKGDKFNAAKRNFAVHGFEKAMEDSGISSAADALREHMRLMYKFDEAKLLSDSSGESESESEPSYHTHVDEASGGEDDMDES